MLTDAIDATVLPSRVVDHQHHQVQVAIAVEIGHRNAGALVLERKPVGNRVADLVKGAVPQDVWLAQGRCCAGLEWRRGRTSIETCRVSGDLTGRAHDGPDAVGSVKEHERRLLDNKGGLQTYRV